MIKNQFVGRRSVVSLGYYVFLFMGIILWFDSAATGRIGQPQTDHPKQMLVCLWDNLSLKVNYD